MNMSKTLEDGDTIIEERQERVVSTTGGEPTLRTAHFLKPTVTSIKGPILKLPSLPLCSESQWPLEVSFDGSWRDPPPKNWTKWVNTMHSKYQFLWKKAGIYEAVLSSIYQIRRHNELIFGIAERWCSHTSSFMFPWGEATVTLEDMMVLGGFSVVGHPASMPLDKELIDVWENLDKLRKSISQSKSRNAHHSEWLDYFMDSGSELEHEAFLSLWLSRFVLPSTVFDSMNRDTFSIAIYLARGIKIALAPAVLATLYRDLSSLKKTIIATAKLASDEHKGKFLTLTVWSPLQYVQIWAWERLPSLQPKPRLIQLGQPRLARWHGLNRTKRENVRWIIDSAGESFLWRPYAIAVDNWGFPKFYKEKEQWVSSDRGCSEEFESFARCLRVSELVGMDNVEPYLPHRVAMQFGMDQDLPGWIPRSNSTPEVAWENYSRPISDAKLYLPSRLFEADVTTRYLEWWKKSVLDPQGEIKGLVRRKRSSRRFKKSSGVIKGKNADFPPGFPPKSNLGREMLRACRKRSIQERPTDNDTPFLAVKNPCLTSSTKGNNADVPPGFPPKCNLGKPMDIKWQTEDVIRSEADSEIAYSRQTEAERSTELPDLEIETRVSRLERLVAGLKAAGLGCSRAGV